MKSTLIKCSTPDCGVSFSPRNPGLQTEDDPSKCLTCNRAWYKARKNKKRSKKAKTQVQHADASCIVLSYARVKE